MNTIENVITYTHDYTSKQKHQIWPTQKSIVDHIGKTSQFILLLWNMLYIECLYSRGTGAGPAGTVAAGPMLEAKLMNLIKGQLQKFWLSNNFSVKFTRSRAPAASPDQSWYASDATATRIRAGEASERKLSPPTRKHEAIIWIRIFFSHKICFLFVPAICIVWLPAAWLDAQRLKQYKCGN